MDKENFIKWLFELYPNSYASGNAQMWLMNYKNTLHTNLDYSDLANKVICNYSGATMPKPAWLLEHAIYKKTEEDKNNPVWAGTVIAFKKSSSGKETVYEFAYGGKANELEDVKNWIFKNGMVIRKIIQN